MGAAAANSNPYGTTSGAGTGAGNRDWMNFASNTSGRAPMDRPTTASNSNAKVVHLENQLKEEKRQVRLLNDQIESLKKELVKANFASFTSGQAQVSTTSGRLPAVPGVREIKMNDIEIGD